MDTNAAQIGHDRVILLWPATAAGMNEIAHQLGCFGYHPHPCEHVDELLEHMRVGTAFGVIVDGDEVMKQPEPQREHLRALAKDMPVVGLSHDSAIHNRLTAVRMGYHAFFPRPLDMSSLLDTFDRLTAAPLAETGQVLIVDDSPSIATFYASVLKSAGFVCQVVTDPLKTLEALADQSPELILLDMHMPGASGEEIAKVIRQQDAYLSTPIVFLSAEGDISRQREAMSLGGDEFLHKPIQPEHLISAVKSRITRYRALRALMVRDSLTGLLNHTSFKGRLRTELARVRRQNKAMSVALIDIDFFKKVNDTYGHPAGDRVIKNLARLLKQRLRGADLVGRYGGEEFAVALPDTPIEGAFKVLDNIRASFEAIVQYAGETVFQNTLSAGVAECVPAWDAEELIKVADEALYGAKHGGRNRVQIH